MDNVTQAIFLAFAMFVLVIGLSYSIYLLNGFNSAATSVIRATDQTSDYQSVSFDSSEVLNRGSLDESKWSGNLSGKAQAFRTRTVSVDTVISTLYRYSKENFCVEIRDWHGDLNQLFDMTVEGMISSGFRAEEENPNNPNNHVDVDANKAYNAKLNAYNTLYGKPGDPQYLFGAPWKANDTDIKQRIDLYVSSQCGYIANSIVDYSNYGLKNMLKDGSSTFTEQFIQYTFDGQSITDTFGEDVESLTVGAKEQKKIIIIYTQNKKD